MLPAKSTHKIRTGKEEDLPMALKLIRELAVFERAKDEVTNTLDRMRVDGFGPEPVFGFLVAERDSEIIGLSLFYYRYSTWKGRCLYLEDLIVTESERRKGIGTALFERTMELAKEKNCVRMNWQVLDWNEPAINFYRKYHAHLDHEWINCSLPI